MGSSFNFWWKCKLKNKEVKMNIIYIIIIGTLFSADMKIGYIDSNRIMNELDEVREVKVELEKEQRKMEVEMQGMISKRDSLVQAYELQKILLVDENKRMEKEKEIVLLEQDIERFQMEKFGPNGGEIYKLQNQLLAPVLAKIDAAIQKIGKERGYNYIMDAVSGALVYAIESHDLTDDVIQELRESVIEQND
tara:strand:- start:421 stop:999 length:579 start_codon:yes stop_codon:yes gene_type:complete